MLLLGAPRGLPRRYLMDPLRDGVRNDAIQPDAGENQRNQGKGQKQTLMNSGCAREREKLRSSNVWTSSSGISLSMPWNASSTGGR